MGNIVTDIFLILTTGEKKKFYWLTACNMLICVLDIFALAGILVIIGFYTSPGNYRVVSFLPAWLQNNHSPALIIGFLIFFLLKNIAAYYISSVQYRYVYSVASRVSQANMLDYLEGNYNSHVHIDSAVYMRKISQQPVEFAQYVLTGLQLIITETVLITLSAIAIVLYNASLFLMVALLLLPVAFLLWFYTRKKTMKTRSSIKTRSEVALQYLKEALAGYIESNIYGKNNFFTQRYAQSQQQLNTQLAGMQTIQAVPARLLEVFAVFGLFVLILAANVSGNGEWFITLGAFMAAAYKIIPGLVRIINLSGQIKAYRFTIIDLLQQRKKITAAEAITNASPLHSVEFRNISFSWQGHNIISNLSRHINQHDFVGITAPSGKGKTTLINILLGLVAEDSGALYINGAAQNIKERKHWWQRTAYVKQQNFLIHDTVEKNITLGDEAYQFQKLAGILEVTGLNSFLDKYPEGLQKIISENGKNISGGQRQRIAIARALYRDTDLIILDEPFNELDNASEEALLQHFKRLAGEGKIIILITHQQSSLSFCNKIISLNG